MHGALASLQQLRTVRLKQCACQPIDEVLAVLAGCPQLQELEVAHGWGGLPRRAPKPPELEGRNLEQLVLGACAGSLWRVAISLEPPDHCAPSNRAEQRLGFSLSQVARLLDGRCPQLKELQLQVLLRQQPLLTPVAANLAAVDAREPVSKELLRSMKGVAQQLQGQLRRLVRSGRLGAVKLQWERFKSLLEVLTVPADAAAPMPVIIKGTVGGTTGRWTAVWEVSKVSSD
jgi:hypothetical protein